MQYKTESIKTKQHIWGNVDLPNQEIDQVLEKYARDGWELFSILPITMAYGATEHILLTFVKK